MSDKDIYKQIPWENLTLVLFEFGDYFIEQARNNLKTGGNPPYTNSNASYNLYDSMETIVQILDDEFIVSVSLAPYWKYVNYGTDPHWPKVDAIRKWIEIKPVIPRPMTITRRWKVNGRRKGQPKTTLKERQVVVTPTTDQLAYLIGRKISIKGTEGTHFFDKAQEATINQFQDKIVKAIEMDIDEWLVKTLGSDVV